MPSIPTIPIPIPAIAIGVPYLLYISTIPSGYLYLLYLVYLCCTLAPGQSAPRWPQPCRPRWRWSTHGALFVPGSVIYVDYMYDMYIYIYIEREREREKESEREIASQSGSLALRPSSCSGPPHVVWDL